MNLRYVWCERTGQFKSALVCDRCNLRRKCKSFNEHQKEAS